MYPSMTEYLNSRRSENLLPSMTHLKFNNFR
jgi:hypothetical protein